MSDKIEVKRGTKVEDDVELIPGKFAIMVTSAPSQEVEGQSRYNALTQCPWCGNVGITRGLNTDYYITVLCGNCGRRFRE